MKPHLTAEDGPNRLCHMVTINDIEYEGKASNADDAQKEQLRDHCLAIFRMEGLELHTANGGYAEDRSWAPRLVFTNGNMFMWADERHWCIGRREDVGSSSCYAFANCKPTKLPDSLPSATRWICDGAPAQGVCLAWNPPARARHGGHNDLSPLGPLKAYSDAADERLATTVRYACRKSRWEPVHDKLWEVLPTLYMEDGGAWGPLCTAELCKAMEAGMRLSVLWLPSCLWRAIDAVFLIDDCITPECGLTTFVATNGEIGIEGLEALVEAARRCTTLRCVDLFHVGPSTEQWESLGRGTRRESEDCKLLLELYTALRGRGGYLRNEAFMEDFEGGGALCAAAAELGPL